MTTTVSHDRPRLIDCCAPVLSLCFKLDRLIADHDADELTYRFEDAFASMTGEAKRVGCRLEDIEHAKYALVALVDERILAGGGPASEVWVERPLQVKYFDEFAAGEEFYVRLDRLRQEGDQKAEVLEVYHAALALGFAGKHADRRGEERRQVLRDSLVADIAQAMGESSQEDGLHNIVAVEASSGESLPWWRRLPVWTTPAVCALLLIILIASLSACESAALDAIAQEFSSP